jgi:ATP-dependent DNA helicase RecG
VTTLATRLRTAVGKPTADKLAESFGMHTVADLLAHYPRRYVPAGELSDLAGLQDGEHATVVAEVAKAGWVPNKNGNGYRYVVKLRSSTSSIEAVFFAKQPYGHAAVRAGRRLLLSGKVGTFNKTQQLASPRYVPLSGEDDGPDAIDPAIFAGPYLPLYPATAKIDSWALLMAIRILLDTVDVDEDPLPQPIRDREHLLGLLDALRLIHRPETLPDVERAKERLKWDEALALQVALARRRAEAVRAPAIARPPRTDGLAAAFDASLPYDLTEGQRVVGDDLSTDLARGHPMHRLLSGEVGSGKTVVALRAMLTVIDDGGQAALLAPTEVLAQQHLRSLRALLGPLGQAGELGAADPATSVTLLTGSLGAAARRDALGRAASGEAGIVVGTHALLSDGVEFADLGLVVVDEQHRFGVEQRDVLRARGREGTTPHLLVMTATPIPRTVAMTVFGDLETSSLLELPGGRRPITSHLVEPRWLGRMWEVVREQVGQGRQAFVVCPRIETAESDDPDRQPAAAATEVRPMLEAGELAGLRLGLLHGRLPAEEKDRVMRAFAAGSMDVLVATTVVEVGVDVPNATVMCVLDADRFGVSQLHQLRGRIGRGEHASTCFLHTALPDGVPAVERLRAVAATSDGVELARLDLQTRGEGDVLGAAQSGARTQLRLLRLLADEEVIAAARTEAQQLVASDPELAAHRALRLSVDALVADASYLEKG